MQGFEGLHVSDFWALATMILPGYSAVAAWTSEPFAIFSERCSDMPPSKSLCTPEQSSASLPCWTEADTCPTKSAAKDIDIQESQIFQVLKLVKVCLLQPCKEHNMPRQWDMVAARQQKKRKEAHTKPLGSLCMVTARNMLTSSRAETPCSGSSAQTRGPLMWDDDGWCAWIVMNFHCLMCANTQGNFSPLCLTILLCAQVCIHWANTPDSTDCRYVSTSAGEIREILAEVPIQR